MVERPPATWAACAQRAAWLVPLTGVAVAVAFALLDAATALVGGLATLASLLALGIAPFACVLVHVRWLRSPHFLVPLLAGILSFALGLGLLTAWSLPQHGS